MPIKLACPACNGRGKIPLPERLSGVLSLVKKGFHTAERIQPKLKDTVTVTAVNHRLSDLLSLGLVERVRHGKYWHYTAK